MALTRQIKIVFKMDFGNCFCVACILGRPVDGSSNRIVITSSTLRISPVEKDDEGFYDCLAENDAGRELASAELTVPARSMYIYAAKLILEQS